jgi:hypothetical protein
VYDHVRTKVTLTAVNGNRLAVLKAIRAARPELGVMQVRDMLEQLPLTIAENLDERGTRWLARDLLDAGATFTLDPPPVEPGLPGSVNMDFKTWLIERVTFAQVEESSAGNWMWEELKAKLLDGDEIWSFSSPEALWARLCGRAGYAVMRGGEIVGTVLTAMN